MLEKSVNLAHAPSTIEKASNRHELDAICVLGRWAQHATSTRTTPGMTTDYQCQCALTSSVGRAFRPISLQLSIECGVQLDSSTRRPWRPLLPLPAVATESHESIPAQVTNRKVTTPSKVLVLSRREELSMHPL